MLIHTAKSLNAMEPSAIITSRLSSSLLHLGHLPSFMAKAKTVEEAQVEEAKVEEAKAQDADTEDEQEQQQKEQQPAPGAYPHVSAAGDRSAPLGRGETSFGRVIT